MRTTVAFLLALLPLAAVAADTVKGTLTVDGKTVTLKHVVAIEMPKEPPRKRDDDWIYQGNDPKTLSAEERASYEEQAKADAEAALKALPGVIVVLSPAPLPAAMVDRVDAFSAGRLAGYLDTQPDLYLVLQFNEDGSQSNEVHGNAPNKVKTFGVDWNFEPTEETAAGSATRVGGTLSTEQDEKRRQFFESASISAKASFDAAIRPVAAASLPKTPGSAAGSLTYKDRKADLKYAYAYTTPSDALSDPGEVTLLLSEIEVPPDMVDSASFYLSEQKKSGVELELGDARLGAIQAQFIGSGNYSYSASGRKDYGVVLAENTPTAVRGQALLSGSDELALDVTFNAKVLPPDEPLELLKGKAAENSSYVKQLRECKAALVKGDAAQIGKLHDSQTMQMLGPILAGPQKAEFLEFARQVSSMPKGITAISVRKDSVRMTTGDKEGVSRSQGTILLREHGQWKCQFDPIGGMLDQAFGQ